MAAVEIFAAVCGVLGTLLLAARGPRAGYGFVLYMGSNAGWLASSYAGEQWALFGQTVVFACSSVWGVWVWLLRPYMAAVAEPFQFEETER